MVDLYALIRGPVILDLKLDNLPPAPLSNRPIDLQSLPFCHVVDDALRRRLICCRF